MKAEEEGPSFKRRPSDASNISNASRSSLRSKTSKLSLVSKASAMGASVKRGLTSFKFGATGRGSISSVATTDSVSAMVDLAAGDQAEVLSLVTLRKEESMDSDVLKELPVGTLLKVLEVGAGRRVQVSVPGEGNLEGWISSKTKLNEPLVMKRGIELDTATMDFEKGGVHEIKSVVTVREEEKLESHIVDELQPGTCVKIEELGRYNNRRVKICRLDDGQTLGWISTCTKHGEVLIGKVTDGDKASERGGGMFGPSSTKIKNLLEAARSNKLEDLKKMVDGSGGVMSRFSSRPNLNSSDVRGKTALIYAAAFGNKELVQYLLTKTREVDVNAADDTSKCALHHSCKRLRTSPDDTITADIVSALLHAGAYMECRDHNGCTPLMFAVANGDEQVVQRLLTAQANLNVKDFEGHTSFDYANNFGHVGLVAMLKKHGAISGHPQEEEEEDVQSPEPPQASDPERDSKSGTEEKKKARRKKKVESAGDDAAAADADGKKKKKKVVKRRKSQTGIGMMEALGTDLVDAADQEVAVEVVTEESNPTQRAIKKIDVLLEDPKLTAGDLKGAIEVAKGAGASEQDLETAEARLKELAEKQSVKEQLRHAIASRDVEQLREALPRAEELKLSKRDVEEAKSVLKEEEPKEECRQKLKAASNGGDTRALKKAIKEATKVGLKADELAEYEELLKNSENKVAAAKALKEALAAVRAGPCGSDDIGHLRMAIAQAREAGVDASAVDDADKTLAAEGPKALAREQLEEAIESCDVERLRAAIEAGRRVGLEASEIKEAEDAVKKEAEKVKLMAQLAEVLNETMSCTMTDIDSVRAAKERLNDAVQAALEVGVKEDNVRDAEIRRKRLHNTIEDLKGSIRVFCRIRPLSKKESGQGDASVARQIDLQSVEVGGHQFAFDSVWLPGTQEEVFEDCKDLVQSAVDGYNVTMFAYGQTGAGKTFTMAGVPGNLGVSPRTIQHIFKILAENESRFQFTVMASMLELYRNDLVDLLNKGDPKAAKQKLNIRQEKNGAVTIEHLIEEECASAEELESLLERGNKQRTVAATAMNSESSRSHLVLMIRIISVNKETKEQLRGKLLICDLAGSERLSKSQVTGDAQKEAIEINKSLTSLGDVIEGLTKGAKVIPYRNHKLTQLMQDSLGGSAKTLMFINCSPASSNQDETVMALKYAQRAKCITNKR